jgi:hypothetical protein
MAEYVMIVMCQSPLVTVRRGRADQPVLLEMLLLLCGFKRDSQGVRVKVNKENETWLGFVAAIGLNSCDR